MNSFGRAFRVSIFGESHGEMVGIIVDGCPTGIELSASDFSNDLFRRKSGMPGTTPRIESDLPEIVSGIHNGYTNGAPITILFQNKNTKSSDYNEFRIKPRPGHADFVSNIKYKGFNDLRGAGHFSGRITLGLVAAGVIAKKVAAPANITALLTEVGGSIDIDRAIEAAINNGDSAGGIIECTVSNVPIGWGEPFFDSIESNIAHIIFSIPGMKGIEFGAGFNAASMRGIDHNDPIISADGHTISNHAGGINGGISNGNKIFFRVAVKPTSSTGKAQTTFNFETGETDTLIVEGRHDACFALRVPPVVEAAAAIVLADFKLINKMYD